MAKKEPTAGTVQIIYHPLDAGDPHTTTLRDHIMHANVAKEFDAAKHAEIIELARGNPWFSVDGKSHKRRTPNREPVPPPGSESEIGDDVDDKMMVEEA
jgi:hypothetical protein